MSSAIVSTNPETSRALVLLETEVTRLVETGKRIPTNLWNVDPALCMSIRDKHNAKAAKLVAEANRNGFAFTGERSSKTGRAYKLCFRQIRDGGARAEKQRASVQKQAEIDALAAKVAALEAMLAATKNAAANANATNV